MKRIINKIFIVCLALGVLVCAVLCLSGCNVPSSEGTNIKNGGKLNIVATIFPQYDFARAIGGDKVNVSMLIKPGAESHTFMPTVEDMVKIEQCDIFICVGGETDSWVKSEVFSSIDMGEKKVLYLTDMVELICEEHEHSDGEEHEHAEAGECDDHVWTSPGNAKKIVSCISAAMCELDADNADEYKANTDNYLQKLTKLDADFRNMLKNAKQDTIIVGDRFPFAYLAKEYGIKHIAAFKGCSSSSEPTLAVVNDLVSAVKENNIPVVFSIEFSNGKTADAICKETGARRLLLHSCHNVTRDEFDGGEGYLSLMEKNLENLREALYE